MIAFTVHGTPVPKARARTVTLPNGQVRSYTPATTASWERDIRWEAKKHVPPELLDGPLVIVATFYLLRPKSSPKRRQYPDTKPDGDNLQKAVQDALEGLLYTNDSRLVDILVRKRFGDPPRVEVRLGSPEEIGVHVEVTEQCTLIGSASGQAPS